LYHERDAYRMPQEDFDGYGGRHVPDELEEALERLAEAFDAHKDSDAFRERYECAPT
jgi:tryptophan synthase beta subunit